MIRSTRDHFFLKRSSKLDFLKTVLVTIIANSEKMKMKKSQLPMTFKQKSNKSKIASWLNQK